MRIAELNMSHESSTGKIMFQIAHSARQAGHEVKTFSVKTFSFKGPRMHPNIPGHSYIGSYFSRGIHTVMGILTGGNGLFSVAATQKLLHELDLFKPEVLHLHNIHQFCLNIPMLFRYIKKRRMKVLWTLHDCWTFTGHCAYFDYIQCDKWKTQCCNCPQFDNYPKSKFDNSRWMHRLKKKWFTGVKDLTLVAPSDWIADMAKQSYLGMYPIKVIKNGIDIGVFQPRESEFRKKYHCEDKFLLLDVAFGIDARKGFDVLVELAKRLDERYQMVLVGVNDEARKQLPENVIAIARTENQQELAEIYTACDLFINPTRDEAFGLVNVEALACGTPVVTFNAGGSPECIDESCGMVVERDDVDAMQAAIEYIRKEKPFSAQACRERAKLFDADKKSEDYVKLYERN